MKMSPTLFFNEELRLVALAIEGHNEALEKSYQISFLAAYNASGLFSGDKHFKAVHPFEKAEEKQVKKSPTKEEREEVLAFIKQRTEGGEK